MSRDSQTSANEFHGAFFDGRSPRRQRVTLRPTPQHLLVGFDSGRQQSWPYESLRLMQNGSAREPVRLERRPAHKGHQPMESLVVEDPRFLQSVQQIAPNALGTFWTRPHLHGLRRFLLVMAVLFIPPFLYGIWVVGIPRLTDTVAANVPVEWEARLGDTVYESMMQPIPMETDPEMQKVLDRIAGQLLATVPNQPYQFKITVHPAKLVNAMALPGGRIVVFQGLINQTESAEELAGVLAHEFQHVLRRHSTRGIIRQFASSMLLGILVGDSNAVMNTVMGAAGQLESLRFSRSMETEADREGMRMILAANVDPEGMVHVFEKLRDQERHMMGRDDADSGFPEWMEYLSTHPAGNDRVTLLRDVSRSTPHNSQPLLPDVDWSTMHRAVDSRQKS